MLTIRGSAQVTDWYLGLLNRIPTVNIIKVLIPVSDMSRTPTVSIEISEGQIPVSELSRTPTISIIKEQTSVSNLSRILNSNYNKGLDTSQ
jgi:hypothetical protein